MNPVFIECNKMCDFDFVNVFLFRIVARKYLQTLTVSDWSTKPALNLVNKVNNRKC